MTISERIEAAYTFIRSRTDLQPEVGLILGSGLGDFADRLENAVEIPFSQIPGFPVTTVEGHAGALILGSFRGRTVAALRGRIHYYEGYSQQEICLLYTSAKGSSGGSGSSLRSATTGLCTLCWPSASWPLR